MIDKLGVLSSMGKKSQPEKVAGPVAPNANESRTSNASRSPAQKEFSKELDQVSSRDNNSAPTARNTAPARENYQQEEVKGDEKSKTNKNSKLKPDQQVMANFLMQMQNEFGVDPEEMLQAFTDLSQTDLVASPEKSAEALIDSLGLNDSDSHRALSMYYQMLAASLSASQSNQQNSDVNMRVLDPKEAQIQKMRASIENLNQRFFHPNANVQPAGMPNVNGQINMKQQTPGDNKAAVSSASASAANLNMANANLMPTAPDVTPTAASTVNPADLGMSSVTPTETAALSKNDLVSLANAQNAKNTQPLSNGSSFGEIPLDQKSFTMSAQSANTSASMVNMSSAQMGTAASNMSAASAQAATPAANAAATPVAAGGEAAQSLVGAAAKSVLSASGGARTEGDKEDKENLGDLDTQARGEATNTLGKTQNKNSFVLNGPKPTALEMQQNVKEIVSQAEFLASKGGGEMKISLNPEGMGELKLKVTSREGQINVEMVTSSSESKKLLEKGLSDLKEHLAAHKLHLESIRIDSSKEMSHQMNQSHQQGQLDRENQQAFLNDFRDRNNNFKREMFEFGPPSRPSSQTRDPAANMVYGTSAKRRSGDSSSSRRLDLVA